MNSRQSIRKLIRKKRQTLTPAFQSNSAITLLQNLSTLTQIQSVNKIAIYLANDGELDTLPFIEWCWQQNIETYLPVLHPFSHGHLLFLKYHKDSNMFINQYGISEPILDVTKVISPKEIDIIFTPLVAFDATGARLGMGGGYYDRTLATLTNGSERTPHVIGLAHDCQKLDVIPTEAWDIPLPQIITPTTRYKFS